MYFWIALNSVTLALVVAVLYIMLRQLGFVLQRLGPVGARTSEEMAPRKGENIGFYVQDLRSAEAAKPALYVFGSSSCVICAEVRQSLEHLSGFWASDVDMFMIYDEEPQDSVVDNRRIRIVGGNGLRTRLGIQSVPFAVLTDETGVVVGRGIVNGISHLESLLELFDINLRKASTVGAANRSLQTPIRAQHERSH